MGFCYLMKEPVDMQLPANRIYADMPPVRLFFHAAVPGMISMFSMSIYNIIEGIFVGQFVGGEAFAAMNLAMPLVMINFALADMVGVGSSAPISIALGQKDEKTASNYFTCSMLLIVLVSLITGGVMFAFAPQIVGAMGAEDKAAELAVIYLRICAALGPLANPVFAMDNYLRISGFVKGSMILNLFMSGVQIVLVTLLVALWQWGLVGSALAVNAGFCVCTLIALIPFVKGKSVLKFVKPRLTGQMVKRIAACGTPTFLSNMAGRIFSLVMNVLLIRMGGTMAVSAFAVMMYCNDLAQPLLYGICDSLQPAIGYNWGAKSFKRVKVLAQCVYVSTAVISLVTLGVMVLFPRPLAAIFVDGADTALLELAAHALPLFSLKLLLWWFGYASQSFYNAVEKPTNAAILTLSTAIVFPLVMVALLWPLGLDGLWLNQAATCVPVGAIALWMLRKTQKELAGKA